MPVGIIYMTKRQHYSPCCGANVKKGHCLECKQDLREFCYTDDGGEG